MIDLRKSMIAAAAFAAAGGAAPPPPTASGAVRFDGALSVLTYNVKGLPWPVATGRVAAAEAIGDRLRRLRQQGQAPNIVLLQEAFTDQARAIAASAGYRYVVDGPRADTAAVSGPPRDAGTWWKGETEGRLAGSGLQIASDFPIVAVRRLAFPAAACAGYDCLANKGAVLVRVRVGAMAVDLLDTHLNSRGASGVSDERADRAYALQADALGRFIRAVHDPHLALIAGGDFNVGAAAPRWAVLAAIVARTGFAGSALRGAATRGLSLQREAVLSMLRAKDWQFFRSGTRMSIVVTAIRVPFGREPDGAMLSDHIGYIADYAVRTPRDRGNA